MVHFANPLGEWLAPLLLALRTTGFFEWYVYIPLMTLASIPLYGRLARRLASAGAFDVIPVRQRPLWRAAYYAVCFLLTNALAVGVKTLIVEEMDYTEPVWFAPLVSVLHFYIASVSGAYLWMIARSRRTWIDWLCGGYVQVGLAGGYAVAVYRMRYERWSLVDPTMAVGAVLLGVMFAAYNWDLARRLLPRRALP